MINPIRRLPLRTTVKVICWVSLILLLWFSAVSVLPKDDSIRTACELVCLAVFVPSLILLIVTREKKG